MNVALLMMGGSGVRYGADIPKQYITIDEIPIFAYILKKYNEIPSIDKIVIVSHENWISYVEEWRKRLHADKVEAITAGGSTRSESVLNGLRAAKQFASDDDIILIHDATHPYVDVEGTEKVIEGVRKNGGATLAACQYDTCYRMDADHILTEVVPRAEIVSGASPEAFFLGMIYDVYANSTKEELEAMTSAGAIALAHGIKMVVVPTSILNLKITYQHDMEVFRQLVHTYFFPETYDTEE